MTEHPNYKYRPRRRKHNKQRAPGSVANPPRIGTSLPSPGLPNLSPRYSPYIPNSSLSPNLHASSSSSSNNYLVEYNTTHVNNNNNSPILEYNSTENAKRYSQYSNFYQNNSYGQQKSPFSITTPDTSPTHSPEPKKSQSPSSNNLNSEKDSPDEDNREVLPTPELSPLENNETANTFDSLDAKNRAVNLSPGGLGAYTGKFFYYYYYSLKRYLVEYRVIRQNVENFTSLILSLINFLLKLTVWTVYAKN